MDGSIQNTTQVKYPFDRGWEYRMKVAKKFIPENVSILDIGGGEERLLNHVTPSKYTCIDKYKVKPTTIRADFNKGEYPTVESVDCIVCLGVLEYIVEPLAFLKRIEQYGNYMVLSYYQREQKIEVWKNHLDYVAILDLLYITDWKVIHIEPVNDTGELLFICKKQ